MPKLIIGRGIQSRARPGGTCDEQGDAPEPKGRRARGPAHGDGDAQEPREDPRVPLEARRDDLRGDREGDGAPSAGGQHRDAGPPPEEVGRQAGHQEGRQGSARPLVPPEPRLVRDRRSARPRGTGENRTDRVEPEEAQDLRVAPFGRRRVLTPFSCPTRTMSAMPTKRPCSTTPGIAWRSAASLAAARLEGNRSTKTK